MATIGIDLGTTNSLAVTYREGEVELIPNGFGEYLTPSVVHVSDDVLTVGKIAKERLVTDPENTAQLFKRSMGTNEIFYLDGEAYSATDLSTLVVKQLVADAESYLGEKVDEVLDGSAQLILTRNNALRPRLLDNDWALRWND